MFNNLCFTGLVLFCLEITIFFAVFIISCFTFLQTQKTSLIQTLQVTFILCHPNFYSLWMQNNSSMLIYIQIINSNFHPLKLTGTRKGQSSALHSFVTQWRKTVDIFWFLCFTKRNTSKENRPIWLLPFSIIVVCGSLSQLVFVEKIKSRMSSCMISILKLLAENKVT